MTHIETLKLALEALESIEWHGIGLCWVLDNEKVESTKAALREALAEPEQEPTLQKKDRKRGSIALARSLCYQINGAADVSDDMEPAQEQEPVEHWSDCAVHSEPAYPKGECNCGGFNLVEPKIQWKQLKPPVSSGQEHMTAKKYLQILYSRLWNQKKPWVGLTAEEIDYLYVEHRGDGGPTAICEQFAIAFEAYLKEKNNG